MKRLAFRLCLIGGFALASGAGCGTMTPAEVCEEHRALLNEIREECAQPLLPEAWLVYENGPCEGQILTCERVSGLDEPREVTDGCLPQLQDDLRAIRSNPDLCFGYVPPEICDEQYEVVTADRTTCD